MPEIKHILIRYGITLSGMGSEKSVRFVGPLRFWKMWTVVTLT